MTKYQHKIMHRLTKLLTLLTGGGDGGGGGGSDSGGGRYIPLNSLSSRCSALVGLSSGPISALPHFGCLLTYKASTIITTIVIAASTANINTTQNEEVSKSLNSCTQYYITYLQQQLLSVSLHDEINQK